MRVSGSDLSTISAMQDAMHGLPRKGQPIGRGDHLPIGDTPGPGWTLRYAEETAGTLEITTAMEREIAKAKGVYPAARTPIQKILASKIPVAAPIEEPVEEPAEESVGGLIEEEP